MNSTNWEAAREIGTTLFSLSNSSLSRNYSMGSINCVTPKIFALQPKHARTRRSNHDNHGTELKNHGTH